MKHILITAAMILITISVMACAALNETDTPMPVLPSSQIMPSIYVQDTQEEDYYRATLVVEQLLEDCRTISIPTNRCIELYIMVYFHEKGE